MADGTLKEAYEQVTGVEIESLPVVQGKEISRMQRENTRLQRENAELRAMVDLAKRRGFIILESEPMAWEFCSDGRVFITYADTAARARQMFQGSGIKVESLDDIKPATPTNTTKAEENYRKAKA